MKLILITKEDWKDANIGVRAINVFLNVVTLLGIGIAILEFLDWFGVL